MKIASPLYSFLSRNSYLLPLGVFILTLVMLLLTLLPTEVMGDSKLWSYDKLGHMVLFGSWSFVLGLYFQIRKSTPVNLWVIFACGTTFGLLIEILQYLLPLKRQADSADFLFDVIGCLAAIWMLYKIRPEKSE